MKVLLWIYLFITFFDLLFFLRTIFRARKRINDAVLETFTEEGMDVPNRNYIGIHLYRLTPFFLVSVTPFVNVVYMYVFFRRAELVEGIFTSALLKKFENGIDEYLEGEEND